MKKIFLLLPLLIILSGCGVNTYLSPQTTNIAPPKLLQVGEVQNNIQSGINSVVERSQNTPIPAVPSTAYSQHNSDYIYAYLSVLSSLYNASQSYDKAKALFGNETADSNTVTLTSLSETIRYLQEGATTIKPYINDSTESISATAGLIYVDIMAEENYAKQMQASFTSAIDNQSIDALNEFRNQMVSFVSSQNSMRDDLPKEIQIIKYIIENPINDTNPTGPIDYAISPDNRLYLVRQLDYLFPVALDSVAAKSNIFLLWARTINIFLTANTYEQQAAIQI